MSVMNTLFPFTSSVISFILAFLIFRRYLVRRGRHLLLWGVGIVTLVGGAAWSAWIFWRKRILLHRTIGNILIAVGAILPAFGGAFSRVGLSGALYVSELLGVVLIFIGYIRAITPMGGTQSPQPEAAA